MIRGDAHLQLGKQLFILRAEVCRHVIRIKIVVNAGVLAAGWAAEGGAFLDEIKGKRIPCANVVEREFEALLVGLVGG